MYSSGNPGLLSIWLQDKRRKFFFSSPSSINRNPQNLNCFLPRIDSHHVAKYFWDLNSPECSPEGSSLGHDDISVKADETCSNDDEPKIIIGWLWYTKENKSKYSKRTNMKYRYNNGSALSDPQEDKSSYEQGDTDIVCTGRHHPGSRGS